MWAFMKVSFVNPDLDKTTLLTEFFFMNLVLTEIINLVLMKFIINVYVKQKYFLLVNKSLINYILLTIKSYRPMIIIFNFFFNN